MANPRELAEKAFTLLQDALRDSESRATKLDAELKRKRAPKNRLEERLEVLTHRFETVEADAERWQREAGHLEEVLENERAKVAQLKKKLEVAESGPDKLTKKEINFWRQRAEQIDAETAEYKNRIASLRRQLRERDGTGNADESGDSHPEATDDSSFAQAERERLQDQLSARDNEVAALRAKIDALLAADGASDTDKDSSSDVDVDALRRNVGYLENALSDAQTLKAALNEKLEGLKIELEDSRDAAAEAKAATGKLQETINERDSRVASLSAELEKTRAELATRQDQDSAERGELEQANARVDELKQRVDELATELDEAHNDAAGQGSELEQQVEALRADLNKAREAQSESAAAIAEREQRIEQLHAELSTARMATEDHDAAIDAGQQKIDELSAELGNARVALGEVERERDQLREQSEGYGQELEQLRGHRQRLETELSELMSRSEAGEQSARELNETMQALEDAQADKDRQIAELTAALGEIKADGSNVREHIAGLEAELKEEKECTANLSEVANERREAMTKLEEQLEEAEERYAEAKWQLGKAEHFERLVKRRKTLIASLIETIRARNKANSALKAGLDGLRTFKATAEANQQKMLVHIDKLKSELGEARERSSEEAENPQLAEANAKIEQLEERLGTQAELIQTLENDVKTAKAKSQSAKDNSAELTKLKEEIETKNQAIERLEADVDEQQKKLAKLRGSENETMRLKGLAEQDKGKIDAMEREIAQLREALARKEQADGTAGEGSDSDLIDKLKERDSSIARLMGTVKEQEASIAELRESVAQWQKKYEFLSTEAPSAYQSVAEK